MTISYRVRVTCGACYSEGAGYSRSAWVAFIVARWHLRRVHGKRCPYMRPRWVP